MKLLMVVLTLGAGLALIGRGGRPERALLPGPDADETREPESWLAGEVEAYKAGH